MAKERKYYAAAPIDYDGKRYENGAEMTLSEETAKPLLAVKAISVSKPELELKAPASEGGEKTE